MFVVFFASLNAAPIADEDQSEPRITSNQLFHQLNEILKREIEKDTKNDSLEVGDKIKGDDGKLTINVQHYSTSQGFPISFKPQDKEVLDDKEIITIVSDFNGSSEYEIKKDSSEEDLEKVSTKSSTKKPNLSTEKTTVTTDKALETSTTQKATTTTEKVSTTTEKDSKTSSTEKEETSTKKSVESSTAASPTTTAITTTTTSKHDKLLKDIAEEPVILTHI